jgi:hypothetical protein
VPGLLVAGVGSGLANAALGRIAVEAVPPQRAGMGSGASNTARYLGGAAGAALVVTIVSGAGRGELVRGWNAAALVSSGLWRSARSSSRFWPAACGGSRDAPASASCRREGVGPGGRGACVATVLVVD